MRGADVHRTTGDEAGQSLIEFALALPLLLLILIGIGDLGRVFYYTSAVENAARVGAAYAAADPAATNDSIAARVCNETGLASYSATPTCPGLTTTATYGPGVDAVVSVSYEFDLVSAFLIDRIFHVDPLVIRTSATFPSMR